MSVGEKHEAGGVYIVVRPATRTVSVMAYEVTARPLGTLVSVRLPIPTATGVDKLGSRGCGVLEADEEIEASAPVPSVSLVLMLIVGFALWLNQVIAHV